MHIDPENPFADIDESEFEAELARDSGTPKTGEYLENIGNIEIPMFVEDCPKCQGTGSYFAVYGRIGYHNDGSCNKCKGTGKLTFKTAPEARAKARKYAKARKANNRAQNVESFKTQFPAEAHWIISNDHNEFASSLRQGVEKYGSLTDGQLAAVRKCIAREADRAAGAGEWIEAHQDEHAWMVRESKAGNEFADSLLHGQYGLMKRGFLSDGQLRAVQKNLDKEKTFAPTDIDLSEIPSGRYAIPDGDTRLKIQIRRPGKNSRYHGWIFVDDGAAYGSRTTYGKQAPGGLYAGKIVDQLKVILEDPKAAAIAYGRLTGSCCVCGRVLEDEASVAAGIGPICAKKF